MEHNHENVIVDMWRERQYSQTMTNVSPKQLGKWLQVRSDDEFLARVDRLAAESVPPLSRSNLIRKLVIEADRKARKART